MLAATLRLALAIAIAAPAPRAPATARTAAEPKIEVPLDEAHAPAPGDAQSFVGPSEPTPDDATRPTGPDAAADPDVATQVVAPLSGGEPEPAEPGPPPEVSAPLDPTSLATNPVDAGREPIAHPELVQPVNRGVGMLTASGVIGGIGIIITGVATATAVDYATSTSDDDFMFEFDGTAAHILAAPFVVVSAGLLGPGMSAAGQWEAYEDVAAGRRHRRSANVMLGAGAGALTLGVVTLATTVPSSIRLDSVPGVTLRETGIWTGLTAIFVGTGMLGYGLGYRTNRLRLDRDLDVEFSPLISRQALGVGVSGRF